MENIINQIPAKFQDAYKELTSKNISWEDIPLNLQNSLLTSEPLSGQEFIELPRNIAIAYMSFRTPSKSIILEHLQNYLISYEKKYGLSSNDFYNKYHDSEAIFDGSQEQTLDFLAWLSDYEQANLLSSNQT